MDFCRFLSSTTISNEFPIIPPLPDFDTPNLAHPFIMLRGSIQRRNLLKNAQPPLICCRFKWGTHKIKEILPKLFKHGQTYCNMYLIYTMHQVYWIYKILLFHPLKKSRPSVCHRNLKTVGAAIPINGLNNLNDIPKIMGAYWEPPKSAIFPTQVPLTWSIRINLHCLGPQFVVPLRWYVLLVSLVGEPQSIISRDSMCIYSIIFLSLVYPQFIQLTCCTCYHTWSCNKPFCENLHQRASLEMWMSHLCSPQQRLFTCLLSI